MERAELSLYGGEVLNSSAYLCLSDFSLSRRGSMRQFITDCAQQFLHSKWFA